MDDITPRYASTVNGRFQFRRIAKWTCVLGAIATAAAWIASAWWAIFLGRAYTGFFGVTAGQFVINWKPLADGETITENGLLVYRIHSPMFWWFRWDAYTGFGGDTAWFLCIPLWLVLLAFAAPAVWLWRRDRLHCLQAKSGLCPACGYDRRGLASGAPCPECSAAAPVSKPM